MITFKDLKRIKKPRKTMKDIRYFERMYVKNPEKVKEGDQFQFPIWDNDTGEPKEWEWHRLKRFILHRWISNYRLDAGDCFFGDITELGAKIKRYHYYITNNHKYDEFNLSVNDFIKSALNFKG